jgi:hypothetical protein
VGKKQKNGDPTDPDHDHRGDDWDHVAHDPEPTPVRAVVPGRGRRRMPARSSPR